MPQPVNRETVVGARDAQRNAGIERANAARKAKKALRMAVKANLIEDLELVKGNLPEYEPLIVKWPVERLLLLCRDIGPVRCDEILAAMKMSARKKVGALSYERRETLARLVVESREW